MKEKTAPTISPGEMEYPMIAKTDQKQYEAGGLHLDLLDFDEKAHLREGNLLINQLHTAIKARKLYDSDNDGFQKQIDKLMTTFASLFQNEDVVSLEVYMHCLFFNRVKIKTEFQNYMHTKFIIDALKRRNTEGVFFDYGLTKEELGCFLQLLAHEERQNITFEEFQNQFRTENIERISIHKFSAASKRSAEEHLMGIRRQAKKTFFECIYNLKGIMFKGKSEQKIGIRRVKRLVQSLVDLIAEDESYLIGLTTMKHYDKYILNHSVNVCILAVALGQKVGLEKNALRELGLAALFHDLGKIPHPTEFDSKDALSSEEGKELTEKHPQYGVEMLMEMKSLGELPVRAMKAILEHHLKFDISGYPNLSPRKELDLFSRIIAIADHFDVATTPQPDQSQKETPDCVLLEMIEKSGKDFDPVLMKLFINAVGLYPIGSFVVLDSGELAVVVQTHGNPTFLDRPIVKVIADKSGNEIKGKTVDLSEREAETGTFVRTILKCLHPDKFDVNVFRVIT
ncbi:MAG: HD domain-containing protein [Gemmatimonadota bacterium]|nr:MAG: HD domain-containing protein [Gemmatimonadota bacterium]